jgi:hypothetical protein
LDNFNFFIYLDYKIVHLEGSPQGPSLSLTFDFFAAAPSVFAAVSFDDDSCVVFFASSSFTSGLFAFDSSTLAGVPSSQKLLQHN